MISAYIYSRYIAVKQSYDSVFAHVVVYFELMFSFVIGALLHRQNIKGKLFIRSLKDKNILLIVCLLVLVSLKCFIRTMAFDPFYSFVFIFLFSRPLKTIFQHKVCIDKLYADSFYKVQKNSHSSFEVICCRS